MDKGAWWATVYGVAKSQKQLSTYLWIWTLKENTYRVDKSLDSKKQARVFYHPILSIGFPDGSDGKEPACSAGDWV